MSRIDTIASLTAGTGIGAIEVIDKIPMEPALEILKLVLQIVVAIGTILTVHKQTKHYKKRDDIYKNGNTSKD